MITKWNLNSKILFFAYLFTFSYSESFIKEDSNFVSNGSDVVNSDSVFLNSDVPSICVYDIVVSKIHKSTYNNVLDFVIKEIISSPYANDYIKWLKIVNNADFSVRKSFVKYFSNW